METIQATSTAWRELNRQRMLPAGSRRRGVTRMEISAAITDPEIRREHYSAYSTNQMPFSDLFQVIDHMPENVDRYSTGELGNWPLDGETTIFPLYEGNFAFVSESISGADGKFEEPIVISILFTQVSLNPIPGLQIQWSHAFGEMARQITVTAYLDNDIVRQDVLILEPEVDSILNFGVSGYNRIDIQVDEWCLPYCRARIEKIHLGFFIVFTNRHLTDVQHINVADPIGSLIPENTLIFEIDNRDQRWNPVNPSGLFRFLLERQEINLRYGYEINGVVEWIQGGLFYLSDWRSPQNGITATFTASNTFSMLDEEYLGSWTGTLYEIAERALKQASLPELAQERERWFVSDVLKNYTYTETMALTETLAQVLQLCAHAAGCALWHDRHGTIHIEPVTWYTGFDLETSSGADFSIDNISLLKQDNKAFSRVATGELGLWPLNGTMETFTYDKDFPFVSKEFSDIDGIFETPPKITITTKGDQRYAPVIRIRWSKTHDEMARRIRTTAFHQGQAVATLETKISAEIESLVFTNIEIFDTIELEILEWSLPLHRARIEHLSIGTDYIIDRRNSQANSNIKTTKELREININRGLAVMQHISRGIILPVFNPLVEEESHALELAVGIKEWLVNRNIYHSNFAADPRLDPLDAIMVINQWGMRFAVCTVIEYRWQGGRFWGYCVAREVSDES